MTWNPFSTDFVPFRERNTVMIGAASLAFIALLLLSAFKAQDLPLIGGGTPYSAAFSEIGGLKIDDEVRIAGVRVGKVNKISLERGHVRVDFRLSENADFGTQTRAAIKVKTILGSMFLALEPAGPGQLAKGSQIPTSRTSSPYDVVDAFSGLAENSSAIDTDQLAAAFTTLADLTRTTPKSFRDALDGLSTLSETLAAKDDQIKSLLTNLQTVSSVLDERDGDIIELMSQGDTLFTALAGRRDQIHALLVATAELSAELSGLIRDSRSDLKPALTQLHNVLAVFEKNQDNLDESLRLMAPFYRVFGNVLGNGPWFDSYIQNMPPAPVVAP